MSKTKPTPFAVTAAFAVEVNGKVDLSTVRETDLEAVDAFFEALGGEVRCTSGPECRCRVDILEQILPGSRVVPVFWGYGGFDRASTH